MSLSSKRYPREVRLRVAAWARREMDGGGGSKALARRLGLHLSTLKAWLEDAAAISALIPVEVVGATASSVRPAAATNGLTVTTPAGFRVDGLTLDEVVTLLARLQQTLALIEQLTGQAKAAEEAARDPKPRSPAPATRTRSGPTPQPNLPRVPIDYELDDADRACPSCGAELAPMGDEVKTSEMVDVVEVSYRVVEVRQRKYVVPAARTPSFRGAAADGSLTA